MGQTMGGLKNSMPAFGGTDVASKGQQFGDMDNSQRAVALIGALGKGFGNGMQNYGQQQQQIQQRGGGMMGPMPQAQNVDPSYFQPQRTGRNNLAFYGDANG